MPVESRIAQFKKTHLSPHILVAWLRIFHVENAAVSLLQ
ncbi:hypothetical protein EPIB2_975 [Tritonibacter mobilis]|nr:hypothetical protein EPIB2_975 [Tritonibacter mobilis]